MSRGRRVPYTVLGIRKVPCLRCGEKSDHQWQICALNNDYYGLCVKCDIATNALLLEFFGVEEREEIIRRYVASQIIKHPKLADTANSPSRREHTNWQGHAFWCPINLFGTKRPWGIKVPCLCGYPKIEYKYDMVRGTPRRVVK